MQGRKPAERGSGVCSMQTRRPLGCFRLPSRSTSSMQTTPEDYSLNYSLRKLQWFPQTLAEPGSVGGASPPTGPAHFLSRGRSLCISSPPSGRGLRLSWAVCEVLGVPPLPLLVTGRPRGFPGYAEGSGYVSLSILRVRWWTVKKFSNLRNGTGTAGGPFGK